MKLRSSSSIPQTFGGSYLLEMNEHLTIEDAKFIRIYRFGEEIALEFTDREGKHFIIYIPENLQVTTEQF